MGTSILSPPFSTLTNKQSYCGSCESKLNKTYILCQARVQENNGHSYYVGEHVKMSSILTPTEDSVKDASILNMTFYKSLREKNSDNF